MKQILYAKYNSLRSPQFQLKTSILEEDGRRYVLKSPMCSQALQGICRIQENYARADELYRCVQALPCIKEGDSVRFQFLKGRTLLDEIDTSTGSFSDVLKQISVLLELIYDFNPDCIVQKFELSQAFCEMFPGCEPKDGEAVVNANLDGLFSNFMRTEDGVWCIDYEWFCDFAVPVRYLKYRTLLFLYIEKASYFRKYMDSDRFFSEFGYGREELEIFYRMEECFQQYVHGKDRVYIYTDHYLKNKMGLSGLQSAIRERDERIRQYEAEIDGLQSKLEETQVRAEEIEKELGRLHVYVNDVHRALKDPVFGMKLVGNKVVRSIGKRKRKKE